MQLTNDQQPTDRPTNQRVSVTEAAAILGISEDAVRSRLKRGTLAKEKGPGGTVLVVLDEDGPTDRPNRPPTSQPTGQPTDQSATALMQAHLDSMREQLSYLKAVIHTRDEELRRKDHIIAALTERIPELEAPSDPRGGPETATEAPGNGADRADAQRPLERRSWWRRFFFGP